MSRFNTGNPLGSNDLKDLSDNAKNLDAAINSELDRFTDRFGVERVTLKAAIDPTGLVTEAALHADRAEAARDSAFSSANVYSSTLEGLASVEIGEQFLVISEDGTEYIRYQKKTETSVTLITRLPSITGVDKKVDRAIDYSNSLFNIVLSGSENLTELTSGVYVISTTSLRTVYDSGQAEALGYPILDEEVVGSATVRVARSSFDGALFRQTFEFNRMGVVLTRDGAVSGVVYPWVKVGKDTTETFSTKEEGELAKQVGDIFWVYPNELNSLDGLTVYRVNKDKVAEKLYTQNSLSDYLIEENEPWSV